MRPRHARSSLGLLATILTLSGVSVADDSAASPKPVAPLRVDDGKRFIPETVPGPPLPMADVSITEEEEEKSPPSHQKGGRPSTPKAKLPEGVPLSTPNAKARHSIAEGPTQEEITAGAGDEQLSALRDAEKVLFPESVRGIETSWSYDVPHPENEESRTLGLPLTYDAHDSQTGISSTDLAWLKSLTLPDLPIQLDRRVVTYLKFYRDSDRGRTIAAIWTRKSGRYVAEIKAKLRRAGLPTDLVWLSMIESGHNPTAESPAGATGLWQFIPESGRMYGLTVDRWVDERRDPARSTDAAIRFLSDLYRRFGNWELAMGAYNMGYAGMSRAIAKYNTNDFWSLSRLESGIPWETTLYVPKIFALAIVMNNRDAFGVGRQTLDAAESFDTVLLAPATSLKDSAKAAGTSLEEIKRLNPQYLADRLPPTENEGTKKWPVRVPRGTSADGLSKLSGGLASHRTYRVRLGDTVENIAADNGVVLASLLKENTLSEGEYLAPGTILVLPTGAKKVTSTTPLDVVVSRQLHPGKEEQVVYYEVRHHDRLEEIAAAFGVTEADLTRWNRLSPSAHLLKGMNLQIIVSKKARLDDVRYIAPARARVFLAGSSEFHEHFEGMKGKKRVLVTAKQGETLVGIGNRYGMTVGSMERVNQRSRSTKLVQGEQLIVYTDKKVAGQDAEETPGSLPAIEAPNPELLPSASRSTNIPQ